MGKSTAADLLRKRGLPVVDSDVIARQAVEPAVGVHESRGRLEGHLARLRLNAEPDGVGPGRCAPRRGSQREQHCGREPAADQGSSLPSLTLEHVPQYRSRVNHAPSWAGRNQAGAAGVVV